jgi:hypothetical protein
MSSLAVLPDLVGFFSYSRRDDENSRGALSRLRAHIQSELHLQLGRNFRLWQDTAAIPDGALWEDEIRRAVAESAFFIPIVTPGAVASDHCRFEFQSFLDRESALGRSDLIFPILYIRVPALESEAQWREDDLLKVIGRRQYTDWQKFRHRDSASPEVAERVELFCRNIFTALHRPWAPAPQRRPDEAVRSAEHRAAEVPSTATASREEPPRIQRAPVVERPAEEQVEAVAPQSAPTQADQDKGEPPPPQPTGDVGATTGATGEAAASSTPRETDRLAATIGIALVCAGAIAGLAAGAFFVLKLRQLGLMREAPVMVGLLIFDMLTIGVGLAVAVRRTRGSMKAGLAVCLLGAANGVGWVIFGFSGISPDAIYLVVCPHGLSLVAYIPGILVFGRQLRRSVPVG